jgi:hypothetical protein
MEYDLQLRKGGNLFTKEWNSQSKDYIENKILPKDFIFHSYDTICLSKNITLRDVFLLMHKNITVFSVLTGCPRLDLLIEEALSVSDVDEDEEMVILKLERDVTMQKDGIYFDYNFSGLGKDKHYQLEFVPINRLVFYPIIVNEDFIIKNSDWIYFKTKKSFTLAEMLNGIVENLSYIGPPNLKEFVSKDIKKSDIVKKNCDSFVIDDVKKFSCCICGADSRAQCFEKPSNMCEKCFKNIKEN